MWRNNSLKALIKLSVHLVGRSKDRGVLEAVAVQLIFVLHGTRYRQRLSLIYR